MGPSCFVPLFIIPGVVTYIILFFYLPETRVKSQFTDCAIGDMTTTLPVIYWRALSTYRLIFIGSILTFITHFPSAFMNTSINTAVNTVEHYFNDSYTERYRPLTFTEISLLKSVMNSEWYAAQMVGSLTSSFLCDNYGRKFTYVLAAMGMTGSIALQALAVKTIYPELFLLTRLGTAFFSPISDTALVMYLQEMSPPALRGTLSSLYCTGYAIMCVVGMTVGKEDVLGYSLPHLLMLPVAVGLVAVVLSFFFPETPKYLITKRNDAEGAERSLRFFQGESPYRDACYAEMEGEKTASRAGGKDGTTEGGIMVMLRTRRLRKAFILTILFMSLTCPFYAFLQSSTHFFKALNVPDATAQTASSYLMVVLTGACTVGTIVVDRFQRKPLLIGAGLLMLTAYSVYVAAAYLSLPYTAIASVYMVEACFGVGVCSVVWTICGELVSTAHRSALFSLGAAITNGLVVATNFLSQALFDIMGPSCFIPLFIVPGVITYIILYFHLPETRGKDPSVIYEELKYGPNKVAPVNATTLNDIEI